jgi:hypothetical protein
MPRLLAAAVTVLLVAGPGSADTVVTGCGGVVPGEIGVLAGDLACNGGSVGVALARGARLDP